VLSSETDSRRVAVEESFLLHGSVQRGCAYRRWPSPPSMCRASLSRRGSRRCSATKISSAPGTTGASASCSTAAPVIHLLPCKAHSPFFARDASCAAPFQWRALRMVLFCAGSGRVHLLRLLLPPRLLQRVHQAAPGLHGRRRRRLLCEC
jgi:hypothetical protein